MLNEGNNKCHFEHGNKDDNVVNCNSAKNMQCTVYGYSLEDKNVTLQQKEIGCYFIINIFDNLLYSRNPNKQLLFISIVINSNRKCTYK